MFTTLLLSFTLFSAPVEKHQSLTVLTDPKVNTDVRHDTSPPFTLLAKKFSMKGKIENPKIPFTIPRNLVDLYLDEPDGALQSSFPSLQMPSPLVSFDGQSNFDNNNIIGGMVAPPDTNGDVGPNHYAQIVNLLFEVWDKNGNPQFGPVPINALWTGFGGPCEIYLHGDPIVLYDPLADRWLVSQFAIPGPFYQCIAISATPDPTGPYHRYQFEVLPDKLNDYPKFGVWMDGYYMSANQFSYSGWAGAGLWVFERDKMLQGETARMQYFDYGQVNLVYGSMLPSDIDGYELPPAGTPNYFISVDDDAWSYSPDALHIWAFHTDWDDPANSTLTGPIELPVASFDSNLCGYGSCITQKGTLNKVDALSDRLMFRLAFRHFGNTCPLDSNLTSCSALTVSHTVDVGDDHAGKRWYILKYDPATQSFSVHDQGTYAPDANHRWMGSTALDYQGNLAVGFSLSGDATYPSVAYAGKLITDPPGALTQGEAMMVAGGGSQTGVERWGDYSAMSVDPEDDCTFWYTQEYYASTSDMGWQTRIGSFKFPGCSAAIGTLQGKVYDANTSLPIEGAIVKVSAFQRSTDATGSYGMTLAEGTYQMNVSAWGYHPQTLNNIAVTAGGVTTQDVFLAPAPVLRFDAYTIGGGNANGAFDPHECATLTLTLFNEGFAPATGVTATLSSTTPGVTVTQGSSSYPDIMANTQATNDQPFQVSIDPTLNCVDIIEFTLSVTTNEDVFSFTFSIPVGSSQPPLGFDQLNPVSIPDNNPKGVESSIEVTGFSGILGKVTVSLYLTHTWVGDLTIYLTNPNGTTITLSANNGGSGDAYGTDCPADSNDTTFDDEADRSITQGASPFVGSFRPEEPLSIFNGLTATDVNGTWTLKVVDSYSQDTGTLQCWHLELTPYECTDGMALCSDTPIFWAEDGTVLEPDSGTVNLTIPLHITHSDGVTTLSVDATTQDNTATANEDYQPVSTTITFSPNVLEQSLTIPVIGDTEMEGSESFFVNFTNPSGITIQTPQVSGIIQDNDGILGDVDQDTQLTAFDASLILQHIVGLITLDPTQQALGDTDQDGGLSAFDASLILQCLVGLCDSLPEPFKTTCGAYGYCGTP